MKENPGGGGNTREKYFVYKLANAKITTGNSFGRLEGRFGCLRKAIDININILSHVLSCFILHNFCGLKNERVTGENLTFTLSYDKRCKPSLSHMNYKSTVNDKRAKDITNILALFFE